MADFAKVPGLTFTVSPVLGRAAVWRWGVWVQGQRVLDGESPHYTSAIADAYVAWVRWDGPPAAERVAVEAEQERQTTDRPREG